nr:MAG TPA: hypothetical protein [Bacteriophage sp.]
MKIGRYTSGRTVGPVLLSCSSTFRIIEENSDELQGFYSNPKIVLPTLPWSARVKGKSSCIVLKQN